MEQKPSTRMQMKTIQTDFGKTIPTFSRKKSSKLSAMKTKYTTEAELSDENIAVDELFEELSAMSDPRRARFERTSHNISIIDCISSVSGKQIF
ncbi:unnamed protein product [Bursaphelenchus xylophilus]|uniref:(pine wood nematode) hypothetical protein n=1 Tax=Bursaphelenchus xylophilus TaxID=6326 RepID=A0A811KVU6_BURXY|nr:unnamed protein product [Bursaphelenchus xylophilus]CAG9104118.1 unnamed protein product [Bursaphelenchus xylophilus]